MNKYVKDKAGINYISTIELGDNIELTANRLEEEPERLNRLHKLVGYVMGSCNTPARFLSHVIKLHDHKGQLQVTTSTWLYHEEKVLFSNAWGNLNGAEDIKYFVLLGDGTIENDNSY